MYMYSRGVVMIPVHMQAPTTAIIAFGIVMRDIID